MMDPRWIDEHGREIDEDHRGLVYDVQTLIGRRGALGIFGGVALTSLLAACGATSSAAPTATATPTGTPTTTPTATTDVPVTEIPDETAGPYPADGSNGIDVLDDSGIVRSDIRPSFGASTTVAEGIPLTVALTVRDAATGAALSGRGVYLWHCDRGGNYSLYSRGFENENYLRGVQETDANGVVRFTTIYPACYAGRWPHIHFEVYDNLAGAVADGPIVKTSQLALPGETNDAVYATAGYEQSVRNASELSLQSDMVFGDDGGIFQLATMSGSVAAGYAAALTVGV